MRYLAFILALFVGTAHAQQTGTSGVLGPQQQYNGTFTSAQLLALNTTPISLIPAPGVSSMIIVDEVIYEYTHVTTDYATNSDGGIFYGTPGTQANSAGSDDRGLSTAVVNAGGSAILIAPASHAVGSSSFSFLPIIAARSTTENKDIEFGAPASGIYSPYVSGDGTMTITIVYRILPL